MGSRWHPATNQEPCSIAHINLSNQISQLCVADELLASLYSCANGNYMTTWEQSQEAEGLSVEFGCASPESRHIFTTLHCPGIAYQEDCFRKIHTVTMS